MMKRLLSVGGWAAAAVLLLTLSPTSVGAQLRAHYLTTLVLSDTTANALIVGGASPTATSGTGGAKMGPLVASTGTFSGNIASTGGNVSDSVGSLATVRAGGLALTSQGAGDVMYATSASQYGRVNGSGLLQLNGASAPTVVASSSIGAVTRVSCSADSGTHAFTDTNPYNFATCTISGLTALDQLEVTAVVGATSNTIAAPLLYNNTDSVTVSASASGIGAGTVNIYKWSVRQRQTSDKAILALLLTGDATSTPKTASTFTTSWTGSWSLALRVNNSNGATGDFSWTVEKHAGQ